MFINSEILKPITISTKNPADVSYVSGLLGPPQTDDAKKPKKRDKKAKISRTMNSRDN